MKRKAVETGSSSQANQSSDESDEEAQLLNYESAVDPIWPAGLELVKEDGTKRSLGQGRPDIDLLVALFHTGCVPDEQKKLHSRSVEQLQNKIARGAFSVSF